MKKLLLLGGDHFLIPVVKAAKALGYYVITCDYLPGNVAHKLSDAYIDYSTTDREGILKAAKDLKIDGVLTYTDSGAVSAAYVAERLGLPQSGPLESVEILQNKDRFRKFLTDNGFNAPVSGGYTQLPEWQEENDRFRLVNFSSQWFDIHGIGPYIPAAYSWPSTFTAEQEAYLAGELQRLVTLLGMRSSVYNVETRIGTDGKPYIMEFSPRGGGNRLSELVHLSTGVDIISNACRVAVGDTPVDCHQKPLSGHWAEVILHSNLTGRFNRLVLDPRLPAEVVDTDLWVKPGDPVQAFIGANNAIGTLILRFDDDASMIRSLQNIPSWLDVNVD